MHLLIILIKFLVTILPVLINVAFVTLLERKILGYTQLRLGPNKISFAGVFQPFRDAVKLFVKQFEVNSNVN
jgi:NADH:ubiquinone oxidoreductase subunit H